MSLFSHLVTPPVRTLGGYIPGKSLKQAEQESGVQCIKLASNENPFGPSQRAVAAMRRVLEETNYYPDNDVTELRSRLAEKHGIAPENILVTAGSTSLLGIMARTMLAPGLNAVTSKLSFIVYPIATKAAGATLIEVPTLHHGFDLDAVAAAIDANTRLVFIANPNNPTGTLLDAKTVDRFLAQVPAHVVVVLDEAYCDFAQYFAAVRGVDYSHSLEHVRQGKNVVVLRTFSKAHGLAGLRIGYGIGPKELIGYFARMRTTFSVSSVAEAAALAALEDENHVQVALANNAQQSQWLLKSFQAMGYEPVPTWANFVYCDLSENASVVAKRLQSEGVIVRPLGPWGGPNAIRVTIGTPEQNQMFLAAFKKVMEHNTAAITR